MNRIACLIMLLTVWVGAPAIAAEASNIFAEPNVPNLNKAMLRAGALDISDRAVLTDYILLNECELYRDNFRDDFKMERLRGAIKQSIIQQRGEWPDAFMLTAPMQLDKYDFNNNMFALAKESRLQNVNNFLLQEVSNQACQQGAFLSRMPSSVSVRIDQPVTLTGLPLPKATAESLLKRMLASGNEARQIYVRFRIVVAFMVPMQIKLNAGGRMEPSGYMFDGTLQGIDFFEDAKMTQLIWTFTR